MKQIYFSYVARKHVEGSGQIEVDDSELDYSERQLLAGTKRHQGQLFGAVWDWFQLTHGDFVAVDALNESTWARLSEDKPHPECDSRGESAHTVLGYLLSSALFWENLALDSMCNGSYEDFVSRHSLSVEILAKVSVLFEQLSSDSVDDDGETKKQTLQGHLQKCSEAAAKVSREIKQKVLDEYRSRTFKSKNKAAEELSKKHFRSYAVVRGWLQGI